MTIAYFLTGWISMLFLSLKYYFFVRSFFYKQEQKLQLILHLSEYSVWITSLSGLRPNSSSIIQTIKLIPNSENDVIWFLAVFMMYLFQLVHVIWTFFYKIERVPEAKPFKVMLTPPKIPLSTKKK